MKAGVALLMRVNGIETDASLDERTRAASATELLDVIDALWDGVQQLGGPVSEADAAAADDRRGQGRDPITRQIPASEVSPNPAGVSDAERHRLGAELARVAANLLRTLERERGRGKTFAPIPADELQEIANRLLDASAILSA